MKKQEATTQRPRRFDPFIRPSNPAHYALKDGLSIPNNEKLPLLAYREALQLPQDDPATICEAIFAANQWGNSWRNGIYPFHHYHSTAHEVLGICRGQARAQFGGEAGVVLEVECGDVVAIPAGVGHKNLGASADLLVVGAYPPGRDWDLCRGEAGERPQVLHNITRVPLPAADPLYGATGPLMELWTK